MINSDLVVRPRARESVVDAQEGALLEHHDESLHPDREMTAVPRMCETITVVRCFLEEESRAEFDDWLREVHGGPRDLTKRPVIDQVIG